MSNRIETLERILRSPLVNENTFSDAVSFLAERGIKSDILAKITNDPRYNSAAADESLDESALSRPSM
jgi:hypothetical protein